MKLTLQNQLLPDGDQVRKLSGAMQAFNAAADRLAGEAFRLRTDNKVELQLATLDGDCANTSRCAGSLQTRNKRA